MPPGGTASASATGRNVTVSWPQNSLPNGTNIQHYRVTRYDSTSGASSMPMSSCEGDVSALTCTENAVPSGTWKYAVAPRKGNWTGTQGALSSNVTVSAPGLSFSSPTTLTSLPSTLNGQISGFITGQSVTFRLDNATSGIVLSSTVASTPIPTNGQSAVTVTIPVGTSNGSHTIYAVGSDGDVAQANITVNLAPFTPTNLSIVNDTTTGLIERGDYVQVTYSNTFDVPSVCSTWSGNGSNQIVTGGNVVDVNINNNAAAGNDSLTVTVDGACGNDFNFGTIDLGNSGFVTGNTVFSGASSANRSTISWNPSSHQLTVRLGIKSSGPTPVRVNSSVTATYTPDPDILSTTGAGITGTATRTGVAF